LKNVEISATPLASPILRSEPGSSIRARDVIIEDLSSIDNGVASLLDCQDGEVIFEGISYRRPQYSSHPFISITKPSSVVFIEESILDAHGSSLITNGARLFLLSSHIKAVRFDFSQAQVLFSSSQIQIESNSSIRTSELQLTNSTITLRGYGLIDSTSIQSSDGTFLLDGAFSPAPFLSLVGGGLTLQPGHQPIFRLTGTDSIPSLSFANYSIGSEPASSVPWAIYVVHISTPNASVSFIDTSLTHTFGSLVLADGEGNSTESCQITFNRCQFRGNRRTQFNISGDAQIEMNNVTFDDLKLVDEPLYHAKGVFIMLNLTDVEFSYNSLESQDRSFFQSSTSARILDNYRPVLLQTNRVRMFENTGRLIYWLHDVDMTSFEVSSNRQNKDLDGIMFDGIKLPMGAVEIHGEQTKLRNTSFTNNEYPFILGLNHAHVNVENLRLSQNKGSFFLTSGLVLFNVDLPDPKF